MKLIVGLFDSDRDALGAREDLTAAGFDASGISTIDSSTGAGDAKSRLVGAGIPERDAQFYAEGVRRDGCVVALRVEDSEAERAIDIMDRHDSVDMDERIQLWRSDGWTSGTQRAASTTTTATSGATATGGTESSEGGTIEVVEEQLRVGKRQTQEGGVRVRTRIVEEPVEEEVRLREERVHVERRPVDRAADAGAIAAFKEGTIEVTETVEEAVVDKTARVVEEVSVSKESEVRTETVRDTVRRTEVDVEEIDDATVGRFRNDYESRYASTGGSYDDYDTAYRYGYTQSRSSTYGDADWDRAEPQLRSDWESRHGPSTWDKVKDAVRSSWDEGRSTR